MGIPIKDSSSSNLKHFPSPRLGRGNTQLKNKKIVAVAAKKHDTCIYLCIMLIVMASISSKIRLARFNRTPKIRGTNPHKFTFDHSCTRNRANILTKKLSDVFTFSTHFADHI